MLYNQSFKWYVIYLTLCLLSTEFVNPPCVCDRGDSSCSNKGKFDDDDDDYDDDDDDDDLQSTSCWHKCLL